MVIIRDNKTSPPFEGYEYTDPINHGSKLFKKIMAILNMLRLF
jgi:hypothetical protein